MLTGASAAMLHPVMLAEVNKLIEHLLAVGTLPCLLARPVEVAHMLLPICSFPKRSPFVFIKHTRPSLVGLFKTTSVPRNRFIFRLNIMSFLLKLGTWCGLFFEFIDVKVSKATEIARKRSLAGRGRD